MFNVIESVRPNPIRFLMDRTVTLVPGHVVQLIEIDGTPSCTLSDGTRPFGMVDRVDEMGLVHVWFDTMVLCTDRFEETEKYLPGNPIYVSERGLLTTKKMIEDSHIVGHVITGPSEAIDYIQINWI